MHQQIKKFAKKWNTYFPCDRVLAQRIFKSTVNSTVAFIFCLIPKVRNHLGTEPSMLPLISVMVHPGRRVSGTIQGAIYCITGLIFGLAYSLFARFLARLCLGSSWNKLSEIEQYAQHCQRYEAALAILAVFEIIMLFFHGWMRSVNHYYFGIVFPLFLVVHFAFLASLEESPAVIAKAFSVPFYLGIAMSLFWNLVLFPEFGSSYLGNATIDALNDIQKTVDRAINFFVSVESDSTEKLYIMAPTSLATLLKSDASISKKVLNCSLVLQECIYEISYSYMSPDELKPVIDNFDSMKLYINGLINACQLQVSILGNSNEEDSGQNPELLEGRQLSPDAERTLKQTLRRIRPVVFGLHKMLSEYLYISKAALAYSYDVDIKRVRRCKMFEQGHFQEYKSKKELPKDFDFSTKINELESAMVDFGLQLRNEMIRLDIDFLSPNDDMFLLSTFLMNFQEVTKSVISIMKGVETIYQNRVHREQKGWIRGKTLWFTFFRSYATFKTWILGNYSQTSVITENESLKGTLNRDGASGHQEMAVRRPSMIEDDVLSQDVRTHRNINSDEKLFELPTSSTQHPDKSHRKHVLTLRDPRQLLAKFCLWMNSFYKRTQNHFRFGLQVTIALMTSSFPMFVPKTRNWYINYHGAWIGFVCILCLEPSVGGTFWVFFLRGVGVVTGSAWAYLSYVAGVNQTNPYLETVITLFGAVPGFYFLLGTPYVKAAIIQIISIYIVMLAAILPSSIPGGILANFAKRCLALGYGGGVALIVQVFVFPMTARDQLNSEIAFVCGCISKMELLYATGLEGEPLKTPLTPSRYKKFADISKSAKNALARASAYKGLTRQEPRLKGEYTELEKVFTQIIFIQKQIIDRMDNVALLRKEYGSAVIEELNSIAYPYRRQVVAAIQCLLAALQAAFLTKNPLPQFLPSARVAHERLIKEIQQILQGRYKSSMKFLQPRTVRRLFQTESDSDTDTDPGIEMSVENKFNMRPLATLPPHDYVLKEKFLSWNASSSASKEIIEYIEELINLTKILVGVNEFKYGFLSRPLYENWAVEAATGFDEFIRGQRLKHEMQNSNADSLMSRSTQMDMDIGSEASYGNPDMQPMAFNEDMAVTTKGRKNNSFKLERVLSRNAGKDSPGLSKEFRSRAYSIGSGNNKLFDPLYKTDTLPLAESDLGVDESSSEDELPLAFQRILSRKRKNK